MAEKYGRATPTDRGVEKAIVAMKKGAHLLKCGRRGKPKFCPFRLSTDEKVLIWYSGEKEKHLKLNTVSKIVLGQQTVNFLRRPQLGKESQSLSLICQNGEQSLDLICKDKEQAGSWFLGLTALLSASQHLKPLASLANVRETHSCVNSPAGYIRRKHNLGLLYSPAKCLQVHSLHGSPPQSIVGRHFSNSLLDSSAVIYSPRQKSLSDIQSIVDRMLPPLSHVASNSFKDLRAPKPLKKNEISSSKHNLLDDESSTKGKNDVLRDIFMWGEGIGRILGAGLDGYDTCRLNSDAFLPKLMNSTRMLDVLSIACGEKHAALVTKQGEVFCWGEEKGGRLGHRINIDIPYPKVVESLTNVNVQTAICGTHHTCAITRSGELYTWGGSSHGDESLDDKNKRNHWFPHRVSGPLLGVHVTKVACGEWHTAVVSSSGQLFTYGDGTFGVLGHGNLLSVSQPKQVECLKGSRVKSVACGPWHTAAIVEGMGGQSKSMTLGGKLYTWGDSDKGRLGHASMESQLLPACVASLVDCDFIQVSCGRMLTVALTVTGIVFTMGSALNGQLGNPQAEERSIATVGGLLKAEFVKEISSGSFHVAALTAEGKVYTWGKGANGRLGLGDTNDRNSPAVVQALENRHVHSVACGSTFTTAICSHKSVSSKDQSVCSECRMEFGFTRKKHNCYNCGFAFCHSCSSKKATNASLAPATFKASRVCDACFTQLNEPSHPGATEEVATSRKFFLSRKGFSELKTHRQEELLSGSKGASIKVPNPGKIKLNEVEDDSMTMKGSVSHDEDSFPFFCCKDQRWGQVPCPQQFYEHSRETSRVGDSLCTEQLSDNSHIHPQDTQFMSKSKPVSAASLEQNLSELDEKLAEELQRLHAQTKILEQQCQIRNQKLQQYKRRIEETWSLAKHEAAKCKAAKDVIKVLTNQMNALSERFPGGEMNNTRSIQDDKLQSPTPRPVQKEPREVEDTTRSNQLPCDSRVLDDRLITRSHDQPLPSTARTAPYETFKYQGDKRSADVTTPAARNTSKSLVSASKEEWVEQDEIGVYVTFIVLPSGQKGLKRVRFSRKHFSEKEAERWWEANQKRLYLKYRVERIVTLATNSIKN